MNDPNLIDTNAASVLAKEWGVDYIGVRLKLLCAALEGNLAAGECGHPLDVAYNAQRVADAALQVFLRTLK